VILTGDVPSPANPPRGCNFSTRCPQVMPVCTRIDPDTREVAPGRFVACHLLDPEHAPAGQRAGQEAP
jgi:oligopeptide transport system ATP-binding protein